MSYLIAQEVYKLCGRNEGFRIPGRLLDCVWEQMNNLSCPAAHPTCAVLLWVFSSLLFLIELSSSRDCG